jgi:lipopolysaccharide export system ATP-binding protein
MSYTDDRDEIAEIFGIEPKKKAKQKARDGYSEEIPEPARKAEPEAKAARQKSSIPTRREKATSAPKRSKPSQSSAQAPPQQVATPASKTAKPTQQVAVSPAQQTQQTAKPEIPAAPAEKKPLVPKKPVKLAPPANVEPHPLEAQKTTPPPAREKAAEPIIEDDEILVYSDNELPDFSESDFISFEEEPARPKEPVKQASPKEKGPTKKQTQAPKQPRLPRKKTTVAKETPLPTPEKTPAKPAATPTKEDPYPPADSPEAPEKTAKREASSGPKSEPGPSPSIGAAAAKIIAEPEPEQKSPAPAEGTMLMQTLGIVKIYDGRTVVKGVDINVRPGEIVGLLGPNGAGKTTSFYMIVGLVPPNDGQVLFNGNDVTHMPMYKRARLGMGYLPQEESIFRKLTVEENIMAVMETLKIPRKEKIERCNELLERFSITHIRNNVALTCSGGEKRRLTIARSLVTEPSLIMLDEPFSGVDPIAVNEIQSIVSELRESGLAILITDHNARQTLELVDRAYLIYEGSVLREGSRDFLINDPVSRELYLGDRFTM